MIPVYQRLILDVQVEKVRLVSEVAASLKDENPPGTLPWDEVVQNAYITSVLNELSNPIYLKPEVNEDWLNQVTMRVSRFKRLARATETLDRLVFAKAMGHLVIANRMAQVVIEKSAKYKSKRDLTIL